MEGFDYDRAVAELEQIALKVEDPSTGLGEIDRYIRRSDELVAQCRAYLRGIREKTEEL
ncbi:MAG: exodeoxyribonuclease VII small subunit [Bacteroidales bacterium]|nr:exodeoxyribonuclease VII small subunit [Candidatus Cryptobacteroides equifaecalis]